MARYKITTIIDVHEDAANYYNEDNIHARLIRIGDSSKRLAPGALTMSENEVNMVRYSEELSKKVGISLVRDEEGTIPDKVYPWTYEIVSCEKLEEV
jgi:hypothetical protein